MGDVTIKITNYLDKGWVMYKLSAPSDLPDGCEECGAFKGSPFETRIMNLIQFYAEGQIHDPFLCEKCYLEADAKRLELPRCEYCGAVESPNE